MACLSLVLLVLLPLMVSISAATARKPMLFRGVLGGAVILLGLIVSAWSPDLDGWVCPAAVAYGCLLSLAPERRPLERSLASSGDRALAGGAFGKQGPKIAATMDYHRPFKARIRTGTFRSRMREHLFTEFACEMPGVVARLVVASREWAGKLRLAGSMSPVDLSRWPYFVRANDASFALQALDAAMRRDVEEADGLHSGSFLLDLRPGTLVIRSAGSLEEQGRLARFTELAYRIAERLRTTATGVEILEEARREEGNCRVCGCALDGELVRCASCSTPHHADCWAYNGGCSVYACGGRKEEE